MGGAGHAGLAAEIVELIERQPAGDDAGADIVAHDDHLHDGVAQRDDEARRHVLEGAGSHPLRHFGGDGDGFGEVEPALMNGAQRRHHDGDLARAGRRPDAVGIARIHGAGGQVPHMKAGGEGLGGADLVQPVL